MKEIHIVTIGNYVGATKQGRCPMYAVTTKDKVNDLVEGLREDFPDFKITKGDSKDKEAVAQFIIRSKKMQR